MSIKNMNSAKFHSQRGVASLLISLVVLVTITFVTLYTSRTVLMEQKISTNDYRGRMAFEAAETGIEAAIAATAEGWTRTADNDGDDIPDLVTSSVFDADKDGTVANNVDTFVLTNGSSVTVTLTDASTNDLVQTNITAVGSSDDNAAQRTIFQTLVIVPPIPNVPDTPLLTRGGVVIGGSATVTNPEGNSTIWSGGDVNVGSNAATSTQIADPTDANYPDCLGGSVICGTIPSSSSSVVGLDVIENDNSLDNLNSAAFFENFFGTTPKIYKESRTDIITTDLEAQDGVLGKIIWVDNANVTMNGNNTFGSVDEPVIIIVDGNYSAGGNNTIIGLLFVMGSITGTGSVDAIGSVVVGGVNSGGGGSLDIVYNSKVLESTFKKGRPAGGGGSWRDFN
ncbi:MAG: PilX N-terminal domain-containing pilus assembly protein [Pseudomonadota bacterium]